MPANKGFSDFISIKKDFEIASLCAHYTQKQFCRYAALISLILSDATSGVISWSSSNSAVASAAGGDISGISPGTATITYTINTGCSTTTSVSVNAQPVITGDISAICPGSTIALTDGANAGTWTSSSTIASVGSTGIVTGVSGGTATITFVPLSGAGCSATAVVTVSTVSAITGPGVVCTGTTIQLSDVTPGGTWSSNATAIVTIGSSTGTITGVAVGSATITYTIGASCSVTSTVTANAGPSVINGAGSLCAGSGITLTDGVAGGTWSSSNTAIGSVDGSGDVTGVSAGTVNITYATSSCAVSKNVTINALPGVINGPASICIGAPATLTDGTTGGTWSITGSAASIGSTGIVTGLSSGTGTASYIIPGTGCGVGKLITVTTSAGSINGNSAICTGSNITLTDAGTGTWTSSNTGVASIGSSTGVLTGMSAGSATISFISGSCFATTVATVNGAVAAIHGATSVCQGATLSLSDATTGGVWSSGNTAIATVGSTGLVTALATTVTIPAGVTITYSAGVGCAASFTITTNPAPGSINGNLGLCPSTTSTLTDALTGGTWSMSSLYASVVGSTGVVTGSATYTGTATISYTAGGCSVTGVVSVNPKPTSVQGATTICAGSSITLSDASQGGTWSGSGDASVTGVGSVGTFVALGTGAGTATATYTLPTGCYATLASTIFALPQPIMGNFNMCVGLVTILSDASPVSSWTSSNTAIAIASGADISGMGTGTATISFKTSSSGNCVTTQVVTVNAMPVVTAINGPATISHAGSPVSISDATAGGIWTSSNTSVITLAGSTGSPINATALTTTGSSTISYAVTILGCKTTVTKAFSASAASHPQITLTMYIGAALSVADDGNGGSWSSSDNTIAAVDNNGTVTGIMPGVVTVTHETTGNDGTVTTTATTVIVSTVPVSVIILPNPNKGTFMVKGAISISDQDVTLEVTDVVGRVIYHSKVIAHNGILNETISVNNALANGMYILNVQTGSERKALNFVITQ